MRRLLCIVPLAVSAAAIALPARIASPAPRTVDWTALSSEAVGTLSDYLKVNTTNPPGSELAGALFLQRILDREGTEATILDTAELGPGRANLYARLKGCGGRKAIALRVVGDSLRPRSVQSRGERERPRGARQRRTPVGREGRAWRALPLRRAEARAVVGPPRISMKPPDGARGVRA